MTKPQVGQSVRALMCNGVFIYGTIIKAGYICHVCDGKLCYQTPAIMCEVIPQISMPFEACSKCYVKCPWSKYEDKSDGESGEDTTRLCKV